MDWAQSFYSQTGRWWGGAEADIRAQDRHRVATMQRFRRVDGSRVLELGCGYGVTAIAAAEEGFHVTGVDFSDRVELARTPTGPLRGAVSLVKADFFDADVGGGFDLVCYWDGFGVGRDADQRRLLRRIAGHWLGADGVALIDIYNPLVWAKWHGAHEHKPARPEDGYPFSLHHARRFDPVSSRAEDEWWEEAQPQERWTQSLRCYSPADAALLVEGTGLALEQILIGDEVVELDRPAASALELLNTRWSYLAVLRRVG